MGQLRIVVDGRTNAPEGGHGPCPESVGVLGAGPTALALAMEAMAIEGAGSALIMLTQMNALCILRAGPEPARQRYLTKIAEGELTMAFALLATHPRPRPRDLRDARRMADTYSRLSLQDLLELFEGVYSHDANARRLVVFDEIQYLPDWERHLKDLVDRYPHTRFIASGSAGAALKRKSAESGAGRFTDFELPPLTFAEFLDFMSVTDEVIDSSGARPRAKDIARLDELFIDHVNFGGYPEVVLNETIRSDMERFVRNDIVQKVLLQDLPTLYGITNIPELNSLFTTVAYNSGQLISLEALSKNAGITKATIRRYLEYLEAAFLIVRLRRVDQSVRRMKRERNFKVYLSNPSMRAALFGPLTAQSEAMGALAETALLTQYLHAPIFHDLCFARWSKGEIDLVRVDQTTTKPVWALEVKWSDSAHTSGKNWASLLDFARKNRLDTVFMTSRTISTSLGAGAPAGRGAGRVVLPLAMLCYDVGRLAASQELLRHRYGLPLESD